MKVCTKCGESKPLSVFCKDSQKKDGLHPHCRSCRSKRASKWREANKEEINKKQREYRLVNLEEIRRKDRLRNNDPKRKASKNARQRYYLVKYRSLNNICRKDTEAIYRDCVWLNNHSKEQYEVDHIVPLQGKNVCGLHVPWNLQILSAKRNRIKSNSF
jgi:hypothetical protein